ncbi:MAG: ATP-dependent protease ATPase subunit HslU [Phycisphaeraceae bacterium]|nr:ATP-dependent protease ATPase subunit HslU [Phycisphaeraceae bacterium]
MHDLTPSRIVTELDRYIIGQAAAKRAVAVAIRNRWRRRQLGASMAREIYPKNIILIGPTGVGKTEIARRMAQLTGAPFLKVEASKFTEVGYHGRDVESMVRDLLEQGIAMVRAEQSKLVAQRAQQAVRDRILDLLLPLGTSDSDDAVPSPARQRLAEQLDAGSLETRQIELTITRRSSPSAMFANMGLDQMDPEMANVFDRLMPEQVKRRRVTIAEARRILAEQETEKLVDQEKLIAEAITRTEQDGIIFLDEIDKIAAPSGKANNGGGPDVSRQGVQRDLLPIVEGSAVSTRHGVVNTDHILFIAAGAFHMAAVSDLMPELQGRFPVRVELSALGRDEFVRILTEPGNALTRQQQSLLAVEGIDVEFEPRAIEAMADLAAKANSKLENIGARRLMTIVEKLFEQVNFEAPEMAARGETRLVVTPDMVSRHVGSYLKDQGVSRFAL